MAEPTDIAVTVNDASVMRIVQQVDGGEQDITPAPDTGPVVKTKKIKGGGTDVDQA